MARLCEYVQLDEQQILQILELAVKCDNQMLVDCQTALTVIWALYKLQNACPKLPAGAVAKILKFP